MDITINKAQKAKPDPIGDYTTPIARTGEQQFACIMRNRSGVSSGEIDFGARFIDRLCDGDQQSAVNSAFAIYEKWCRETGKRAPRDKSEALEKDFAYHAELCTSQQARIATQQARIEALEAEVQAYRDIRSDSTGVAGYYPNGDSALWDEFDIPEQEGE